MPILETQPQILHISSWVPKGPGTNKLPSNIQKVCRLLLPYPMTVWMHIKLPYFLGLWLYLHLSGIPLYLFSSSRFPPQLCLPSCLPSQFWTVTCLHLSAGMVSHVGGLPSSSVLSYYSYRFCPSCSRVFLRLRTAIKLEVPLMFWVIPWICVEPSSLA